MLYPVELRALTIFSTASCEALNRAVRRGPETSQWVWLAQPHFESFFAEHSRPPQKAATAPSERQSDAPWIVPSGCSTRAPAWPIRSLKGDTISTSWPTARKASITSPLIRDSTFRLVLLAPQVRPSSQRGAVTAV